MSLNDPSTDLDLVESPKALSSTCSLIGGVDEAGRGSIIGPLVIAGVSLKRENSSKLRQAGVCDSKLLTVKARQRLYCQIIDLAEHICIFKSECSEVDQYVFSNLLNKLEAKAMATVIDNIFAKRVYVDARRPESYFSIFGTVDLVYCDIAQSDQTEIAIKNCNAFLKKKGIMLVVIKTRSIDVTMSPRSVVAMESDKLRNNDFVINQTIDLEPFDKDHALIHATYSPTN